ncbi:MAG: DUF3667 domain-containing protein [Sphingomonadales bacterium]|nr:MAG: DUF3667 domain-containing protein [Sphingomonadales bacterium]
MTGEIEAVGELATGALLGRAVEPDAGEGHGVGEMCLNCGTTLIGQHCHRCGQIGHVHRSLAAMGHEIVHGVFHFEGKLWRTLPMLAWRPGELTRRYIEGERARFVSPMAIFLFSIFAMFAVFGWAGISVSSDIGSGRPETMIQEARKQLIEQRAEAVADRDEHAVGDRRRTRAEVRIKDLDKTLAELPAVEINKDSHENVNVTTRMSGWAAVDHGVEKWQKNPALMLYKLQSSVYKFSWMLIPISLPFLWLLFAWKRQYKLYDHTVFITYSIAFMSLLYICVAIMSTIGVSTGLVVSASLLIPFAHIARQLKQAYALRWWSAIVRTFVLSFFISIAVAIFLTLLVLMGMLG